VEGGAVSDKAMTLRLPTDLAEDLDLVCMVDDVPMAEAVRTAIAGYIEARRQEPHSQLCLRAQIARMQQLAMTEEGSDA
jgi:hypothetical protein